MSQDRIAELERENERLKQVCNCDLSNSAGVTIAGGRHSCGRIFVGSRVKELEAEVARLKAELKDYARMDQVRVERVGKDIRVSSMSWIEKENLRLSEQLGKYEVALTDIRGLHYNCQQCALTSGESQCVTYQLAHD
jgi:uncharacterized small protein (DUF1192 family)